MDMLNVVLKTVAKNGMVKFPFMESEEVRSLPIETLNIDVRSYNGLMRNGVETIGDLLDKGNLINTFRNLGKKSCGKIMYELCVYQYNKITDVKKKEKYIQRIIELNQ